MIGAGNVAWHLAIALHRKGIKIIQICNRTKSKGEALARKTGAHITSDMKDIEEHADLYILAVHDAAIPEVAHHFPFQNKILVHVSGSIPMSVLRESSTRPGVIYPLQVFSSHHIISFRTIPLCIEAGSKEDLNAIKELALTLSDRVYEFNSDQRRLLHLAAVFAGNFSHFMYVIAEEILKDNGIPFDLLQPLIRKIASNANSKDLFHRQTGPAVREDQAILDLHREMIAGNAAYRKIYDVITKSIIQYKRKP